MVSQSCSQENHLGNEEGCLAVPRITVCLCTDIQSLGWFFLEFHIPNFFFFFMSSGSIKFLQSTAALWVYSFSLKCLIHAK